MGLQEKGQLRNAENQGLDSSAEARSGVDCTAQEWEVCISREESALLPPKGNMGQVVLSKRRVEGRPI